MRYEQFDAEEIGRVDPVMCSLGQVTASGWTWHHVQNPPSTMQLDINSQFITILYLSVLNCVGGFVH